MPPAAPEGVAGSSTGLGHLESSVRDGANARNIVISTFRGSCEASITLYGHLPPDLHLIHVAALSVSSLQQQGACVWAQTSV